MLGFTDVALGAFLKSIFLEYPITLAPPELSRKNLARYQDNTDVGVPGLSYWRTNCPKHQGYASQPQAVMEGFNSGRQGPTDPFDRVEFVRVRPTYNIQAWTRDMSRRNIFERELMFMEYFKTIEATIKGGNDRQSPTFTSPIRFAFETKDPVYREVPDEATGKVIWYGVSVDVSVTSQWMRTRQDPWIDQIILEMYQLLIEIPPHTTRLNPPFEDISDPLKNRLLEVFQINKTDPRVTRP